MAITTFATGNALTKKLWEKQLYEDTLKMSFFSNYRGGANSIVHVRNNLKNEKGDRVTFGIRMRETGAGVTSGTTLEGKEASLTTHSFNLTLEQYRHAVRVEKGLSQQRVAFSITEEARDAIMGWGTEKIDSLHFAALDSSPSKYFSLQSGSISGDTSDPSASITATDLITPDLISFTRTWAKTGGARDQTPLRPIMVNGKKYYLLLVHPDVRYDLDNDPTFAQARREAEVRGKENPIFAGSYAIWNGVVIADHENITTATTWGGASVAGAKNVFLGAQALCYADTGGKSVVQKEFDYDNEIGYAWQMIMAVAKPTFNSTDYGSVAVWTARTNVSGS
jgi:N4-gp56 family major capsid protein